MFGLILKLWRKKLLTIKWSSSNSLITKTKIRGVLIFLQFFIYSNYLQFNIICQLTVRRAFRSMNYFQLQNFSSCISLRIFCFCFVLLFLRRILLYLRIQWSLAAYPKISHFRDIQIQVINSKILVGKKNTFIYFVPYKI